MGPFNPFGDGYLPPRDALSAALRILIISACSRGEVGTTEFAERYGQPAANVRYHFSVLLKAGVLRIAREDRTSGFPRRYYVAVHQQVLMDEEFARMKLRERHGVSLGVIWDLFERCREAREAGTINARVDSHLRRCDFLLDLAGWTDLMEELKRIFDRGFEIQAESLSRLKAGSREWIPTTFGLAGFESPRPARHAPGEVRIAQQRAGATWAVAVNLREHCKAALRAGTMDRRADSHLSWSPFLLDRASWCELMAELGSSRERAFEIQAEAVTRMSSSGERPIPTTLALIGFESPTFMPAREEAPLGWPPQELAPVRL